MQIPKSKMYLILINLTNFELKLQIIAIPFKFVIIQEISVDKQ